MKYRLLIVIAIVFSLQDCSWIQGWGDKDPEPGDPVPLSTFTPTLATQKNWSVKIGDGIGRQRTQLRPAYSNGTIYAADYKGLLVAIDAESGKRLWEVETGLPFSGGPGVQGSNIYVGTEDGEVHKYAASGGTSSWVAQVSSEQNQPARLNILEQPPQIRVQAIPLKAYDQELPKGFLESRFH